MSWGVNRIRGAVESARDWLEPERVHVNGTCVSAEESGVVSVEYTGKVLRLLAADALEGTEVAGLAGFFALEAARGITARMILNNISTHTC
jgi:hypothetical protein